MTGGKQQETVEIGVGGRAGRLLRAETRLFSMMVQQDSVAQVQTLMNRKSRWGGHAPCWDSVFPEGQALGGQRPEVRQQDRHPGFAG